MTEGVRFLITCKGSKMHVKWSHGSMNCIVDYIITLKEFHRSLSIVKGNWSGCGRSVLYIRVMTDEIFLQKCMRTCSSLLWKFVMGKNYTCRNLVLNRMMADKSCDFSCSCWLNTYKFWCVQFTVIYISLKTLDVVPYHSSNECYYFPCAMTWLNAVENMWWKELFSHTLRIVQW